MTVEERNDGQKRATYRQLREGVAKLAEELAETTTDPTGKKVFSEGAARIRAEIDEREQPTDTDSESEIG